MTIHNTQCRSPERRASALPEAVIEKALMLALEFNQRLPTVTLTISFSTHHALSFRCKPNR